MPLLIVRNDITKMKVDAIVNAANRSLLGGGGVDGRIHRAAGPELLKECRTLGGCETGSAKITKGYRLPAKYIIHTVGPVWRGGKHGEKELLASCYRTSLKIAKEYHCETVAFPLISSGADGYPKEQALHVAEDTIRAFLDENEMMVYLVIFDQKSFQIGEKLYTEIVSYIDESYVKAHTDAAEEQERYNYLIERLEGVKHPIERSPGPKQGHFESRKEKSEQKPEDTLWEEEAEDEEAEEEGEDGEAGQAGEEEIGIDYELASSLEETLSQIDESFSEMLLRKIDESGMTDAQCYKRANIDRKLFSKIRSNPNYQPSKRTVLAFAIALELPLNETREMLEKAGFSLSHSSRFDLIVEFFICRGDYDIFEINEALFSFDQPLLGG